MFMRSSCEASWIEIQWRTATCWLILCTIVYYRGDGEREQVPLAVIHAPLFKSYTQKVIKAKPHSTTAAFCSGLVCTLNLPLEVVSASLN